MTAQMDDYAAQRSPDGWTMTSVPCPGWGGNSHIHLLDEQGNQLVSLALESSLPNFSRFAHWTTAGMSWSEPMLGYFTEGQRHFVVRAWWGSRLVIALDTFQVIEPIKLSDELHRTECDVVLRGLRRLVAHLEDGGTPRYDWPATDVIRCTIGTLAHFPGLLGLVEAAPMLRVVEERVVGQGSCISSFCYTDHEYRRLAQISLRRLGETPRGYPGLTFSEREDRIPLRRPQPGPIDGRSRHANLLQIRKGASVTDVYGLLGSPDEVGHFWRYDIDGDPSYTVLLWLADDDSVTRIVRYSPPFWTGPDVFPSREHSLLGSDGTTVAAFLKELDDGTFIGTRIEVDVLQELASSERLPMAPLAQAILEGLHDALGPLTDALEEAGDPRAGRVCAAHGVATRGDPGAPIVNFPPNSGNKSVDGSRSSTSNQTSR